MQGGHDPQQEARCYVGSSGNTDQAWYPSFLVLATDEVSKAVKPVGLDESMSDGIDRTVHESVTRAVLLPLRTNRWLELLGLVDVARTASV